MKQGLFRMRAIGLGVAIAALSAVPAHAAASPLALGPLSNVTSLVNFAKLSAPVDPSACSNPEVSQPFASYKDDNEYAIVPGQNPDDFYGGGWTFAGGARIVQTKLVDGAQSEVLSVPSSGVALSPPMCVSEAYPTARMFAMDSVRGAGAQLGVAYFENGVWKAPVLTGVVTGPANTWGISKVYNIHPGKSPNWEYARFVFAGNGLLSETRIYDFYVDPRMRW